MQTRPISSDAERLAAIQQLESAIAAKEPPRNAALTARDAAKQRAGERRNAVKAIEGKIRAVGALVLRKSRAAYLNGESLDRGTLQLGNEFVRFTGWRGSVEIPLKSIEAVDLGASLLSPRAGVPLLEKIWPGTPRAAKSLILMVRHAEQNEVGGLVVVSDLSDGEVWQSEILKGQDSLQKVAAQRAELESQRQAAVASLTAATNLLEQTQSRVDAVEAEIAPLRAQRDKLRAQQREVDAARQRAAQAEREALKRAQRDANQRGKK